MRVAAHRAIPCFGQSLTARAVFWFLSLFLVVGSTESARNGQILGANAARVGSGPGGTQHGAGQGAQSTSLQTAGDLSSMEAAQVCRQTAQDGQLATTCSSVVSRACTGQMAELSPEVG